MLEKCKGFFNINRKMGILTRSGLTKSKAPIPAAVSLRAENWLGFGYVAGFVNSDQGRNSF